jgi:hypothetical protein
MAIIDINIPIEDAVTDGSLNPITSNAVFDALSGLTSPTLQDVTDTGNTTTNDIEFTDNAGILLENTSRLREGTIDSGAGGGIAQICAVGYELKWEAGSQYVMDGNGTLIREVNHKFNIVPDSSNDSTQGFYVGSRWVLDNGDVYVCTDSTSTAAVWEIVPNADWNATTGSTAIANKPTIPSVTGFVPYTGATNDVNLGVHDLTATQGTFATSGNPDTLTVNHSSGSGKALTITKGGNGEGVYVNKTSGSGNAVTIIGDLEATNLKRTGGTSSQFLKANGSIDSTSYQPTLGFTPENAANKQNSLNIDGTGTKFPTVDALNSYGITVDLIDALTVDFALGYSYKINSVTNVTNAPTTTILDDGVTYTLGATIVANSVMKVTVSTAARVQLNITRL